MSEETGEGKRPPAASQGGSLPPGWTLADAKPPREWRTRREVEERRIEPPRALPQAPPPSAFPPALADVPVPASAPATAWAPPETPAPALEPPAVPPELPHVYGVDRLVVLVRDPYWVYAWWELGEATLAGARAALGAEAALVLRVYDVSAILWDGANHHSFFDIEIWDLAGGWYVELGKPGASFVAEVGLRTADGRFLAILRSNFVTLPRDGMSDVVDEEWMLVEEDYRMLYDLAGGLGHASGDVQRLLEQRLRAELESAFASRAPTSFGLSSPAARR